jgi:hypothetical protein
MVPVRREGPMSAIEPLPSSNSRLSRHHVSRNSVIDLTKLQCSEQIDAPLHLPVTHKRPHNVRPHPSTSFGTDADTAVGHIAITVLPKTNEAHSASCSRRAANRPRLKRVGFGALELGRVEANATASRLPSASTGRRAIVVAEAQQLAVGVASRRHTHTIATIFADCARIATSTAVLV